ncbi:beta-ketoacyl reductase, partial [Anabaena sp. UHCC 0253]|uniref:beta-ketoacyl reductase n=1 Tax=Anabaena sp. UHCC 0253 TaxID=2590019 RepID=UPI0014488678
IVVYLGENYQKLNQNHYQICPSKPADFEKLLQEISSTQKLDSVVHLWSLQTTTESLTNAQALSCGSVLHLVQAMVANSETKLSQLCLVTQGVHQIDHDQEPVQVQQAPLWGLGKVVALEHPEFNCRCLDLEIGIKSAEVANIIFDEITDVDIENQIAYRQGVRHVMRLGSGKITNQTAINIDSESSYLITGGLGALGLSVAHWLGEKGAKHLVLMGRNEPSQNAQIKITELETLGIQVSVRLGDISQPQDVEAIIEQIEASGKPLKGVIHGAGMLDDGMLRQITWERFSRVMQPKVEGAWNLHQFTKHLPLDFFVCFSSIASLLGSPGQGNYAAANAFMDALVYHRRALGLPGLSVNWGPWNDGGMAARLGDQYQQRLQSQGITSISPEIGFQALADLLSTQSPQVGVFSINWSQWLVNQPQYQKLPFLAKYRELNQAELTSQSEFLQELEAAIPSERRAMLEAHISRQVAGVLGLSQSRKIGLEEGFFDLGMDSLTSVDLRNRLQVSLGCSIPSTGAFDYPTIGDMVNYLIQDILEINFSEIEPENVQEIENINQELEDLSEEEIASLLAAELNGL